MEEKNELISKFIEDLKHIKESFRPELPNSFVEDIIQPYEKKWEKELSDPNKENELNKGSEWIENVWTTYRFREINIIDLGKSIRFYHICTLSNTKDKKKMHFSLQDVRIKGKKIQDKDIRRMIKTLINSNFFIKHPTGGSTTYHLSIDGLRCCNIIRDENVI